MATSEQLGRVSEVSPRQGPRNPLPSLPPRRPGSLRRTMQIEVGPRTEFLASMPMTGSARDVHTDMSGTLTVVDEASIEAGFDSSRCLDSLVTSPEEPWAQAMIGARSGGGYRATLASTTPPDRQASLMRQVLDDLPATWLISGYAVMRISVRNGVTMQPSIDLERIMSDVCSGWRADGEAIGFAKAHGSVPLQVGPPVGDLGDPESWPSMRPLALDWMRRRRCMDVVVGGNGEFEVWAMFRDSVGQDDGTEIGLHEYVVRASGSGDILTAVEAEPRVLPFLQCPAAADEVGALVGMSVADLSTDVGSVLTGIRSCTHLNDLLRSLGGLAALLERARSLLPAR